MEDLHELANHWRELGRELNISEGQLDSFCPIQDNKENLCQVLRKWMDQKAEGATLTKLANALVASKFKELSKKIIKDPDVRALLSYPG